MTGPIYLVPELCFMTGLSDEQRANFQLMKALVPLSNRPSEQSLMRVRAFNYKCSIRYMTCLLGKRDVKEGVGGGQEDHC